MYTFKRLNHSSVSLDIIYSHTKLAFCCQYLCECFWENTY